MFERARPLFSIYESIPRVPLPIIIIIMIIIIIDIAGGRTMCIFLSATKVIRTWEDDEHSRSWLCSTLFRIMIARHVLGFLRRAWRQACRL
jgi:hypothetical protein